MKMKNLLFILLATMSFQLFAQSEANLLGRWDNPDIPGTTAFDNTYNEIWGYAINGQEYAIMGSTAGTHFINVTDPSNPVEDFFLPGGSNGTHIIHRDYHDFNGYLYAVAGEGGNASTLQVIDMSDLPNAIDVVYDSNESFSTSHNIFIDEDNGILYGLAMQGGAPQYSALRLIDINDPLNPIFLAEYNNLAGVGFGHVHDAYVRNNKAFLNLGPDGLVVVDFTDPMNPVGLGSMTSYPESGYNHSGWANDACTHYFFADETWGTALKSVNIEDPTDLEVNALFDAGNDHVFSIAHNQIVACDILYSSYYYDGIQAWDISDPENPERIMYYGTSSRPLDNNYEGAWGVYPFLPSGNLLVSDMQEGLFVFEGIDSGCDPKANIQDCFEATSTNVTDTYVSSFELFPQPATHELNLVLAMDKSSDAQIELLDLRGQLVQSLITTNLVQGENNISVGLNQNLSSGMYILRIQGEQLNIARKIIVE